MGAPARAVATGPRQGAWQQRCNRGATTARYNREGSPTMRQGVERKVSAVGALADLEDIVRRAARGDVSPHTDEVRNIRPVDPETARRAGVLVLFGRLDSVPADHDARAVAKDIDLLLMERAADLNNHPGQVSLPGGGVEPGDAIIEATALREAVEETGLNTDGVRILGPLPAVGLPVSNYLVTPVLAWWDAPSPVQAVDQRETRRVFRVPVTDLLNPDNRVTCVINHKGAVISSSGFLVDGVTVWGFTGMLLDHLFNQLGWTEPWDRDRTIPAPI